MNDPEPLDLKADESRLERLDEARTGFWLFGWIGLGLATLWWTGASIGAFVLIDPGSVADFGPMLIIAALVVVIFPGFMMVMTGLLAREQARSGAANAIVLEAASSLLSPAPDMAEQAGTLAGQMAASGREISRVTEQAVSAMKAVSEEIGNEWARLESVSYASSDNARELVRRLAHERSGLEKLSRDLHEQVEVINQAIPRQTALMVDSARTTAGEVAHAEEALKARLEVLDRTARSLYEKIAPMDTIAGEAGQRNEALFREIVRMDEKLEQIRQTIEATARASELAVTSAHTTGNRLTEAITMALDSAEQVSATIQNQTLETAEAAARILADLKETGRTATATMRADRPGSETAPRFGMRRPLPSAGEDHPATRQGGTSPRNDPRMRDPGANLHESVVAHGAGQPEHERPAMSKPDQASAMPLPIVGQVGQPDGQSGPDTDFVSPDSGPVGNGKADQTGLVPDGGGHGPARDSLRDIIADMEREEHTPGPREETAGMVISQLEDSGIRLHDVFHYRHKKKIAAAAREGPTIRRDAINRQARRQVERVRKRLKANPDLASLARDFVTLECTDALNALEDTAHLKRNASARLAGYLLLDAAMSEAGSV